jgi:hypothetical protein
MVVCGQEFTPQLLERINDLAGAQPQLSRRALSRQVCEWLDWRGADGRLKQMSCRVALGKLARAGALQLPQPAAAVVGARAPSCQHELLSGVSVPLKGQLAQLGCIDLVLVGSRGSAAARVWKALLQAHHYLGAGPLCGAQLRYLVRSEHHGIVAALAFSASAWRVGARDRYIGWSEAARAHNLGSVVANSRFLIVPGIEVAHLASHVLGLCVRRLPLDWQARYGYRPLLLESFVERTRFKGSCYRAANWMHVGHTSGRGRQDRTRRCKVPLKDVYLYPLQPDWRARLCAEPAAVQAVAASAAQGDGGGDWAQQELGRARLGDARLEARLITLTRDFYAQPRAQIPQACGTRAKTKAAYRFFDHPHTGMDAILQSHYQASAERAGRERVVLAVQDTTSLNYDAQPAIENLGPIGSRADAWFGLMVHDTMAFSVTGLPLGLIDVQCWAREAQDFGKKHQRKRLPFEAKESYKWARSVQAAAALQARLPQSTVVSVGDREADIFELFDHARGLPHAPMLLIRAEQNRTLAQEQGKLWEHLRACPIAGCQQLQLPRRHNRPARVTKMTISHACVELEAPKQKARLKPVKLWAVWARELEAPAKASALEWMLLTTCEVDSLAAAVEKLAWYTQRWGIEVYHRTLKSGCQIENRQLGHADRIEACLAIDLVVAWRILHLSKLGREHPDVPCTVYFSESEWKALLTFVNRNPHVPAQPPSLREATRLVAGLGGFLGRKCDGEPGTQTLWLGLQRLDDITAMYEVFAAMFARPPPTVSSGQTYG